MLRSFGIKSTTVRADLLLWPNYHQFYHRVTKGSCTMLVIPLLWLVVVLGIYIAALRNGMQALRWALVALFTGPLLLPLFTSHKRLRILQARLRHAVLFRA